MKNVIAQNALEIEMVNNLLSKQVPTYRQAYSDRTSWLMACFSELAYLRFNPLFTNNQQKELITTYLEEFTQKTKKSSLIKLLDIVGYDHKIEIERLGAELESLNAKLVKTFDSNGTQAILISTDKFITLAFRGTESTSVKDIKSDAKATTTKCDSGGNIHSGFKQAFEEVAIEIQHTLNQDEFKNKPLFITGHSLGGALATIAAKKLKHTGGMASCYTFGSPRVGDEKWISNIKTPLYRVVNAADCVTMMPPGSDTISAVSWLLGLIPQVGKSIRSYLLSKFGGYLHGGNMRYLTNCAGGSYDAVNLLYSVTFLYRIKMLFIKSLPWSKPLADHSITLYRKKLAIVATNKN
ncbi:Lipase family protein [Shewanella piezotolerans WP3]|uniref:Lipase family protein n=1 Tax=Shewanella piezotolerans (strain WP3 / JCM 13877) TaxID=225849 RepID=B8CUD7_SHEPW|nr:lipase family protein [Shewanella piezotolerans]ACJ31129.1 Lipase family protein [Shewanella piezotolerans WP3]